MILYPQEYEPSYFMCLQQNPGRSDDLLDRRRQEEDQDHRYLLSAARRKKGRKDGVVAGHLHGGMAILHNRAQRGSEKGQRRLSCLGRCGVPRMGQGERYPRRPSTTLQTNKETSTRYYNTRDCPRRVSFFAKTHQSQEDAGGPATAGQLQQRHQPPVHPLTLHWLRQAYHHLLWLRYSHIPGLMLPDMERIEYQALRKIWGRKFQAKVTIS
ncbi:hypothetical protein BGX38DRAFT_848584 [Terfezia claveryi]|nr:hypothetical protein BGX38DRAFT_848584 [Terfezia claveryi]